MAAAAASPAPRAGPARLRRARRWLAEYLPPILLLVALVGAWELWVRAADTKPYLLPAPSRVWDAFLETRGALPGHIRTTLGEALLGLFFAALIGVTLAVLMAVVPLVRRVLYPLMVVSQTIPMIVLAPWLIILLGFGMTPKVVVVTLVGFFPIVVATADGLSGADRELVDLVRSMGARRLDVLRQVMLPSALPGFFAGLKIAATYAVLGAVIGEYVGAASGLGLFISRAESAFRTDRVFVAVVVVALSSIALFGAATLAARLATPWLYVSRSEDGT